jgi:hypothetical protein
MNVETNLRPVGHKVAIVIGAAIGNGLSYAVLFICGLVFLWTLVAKGIPGNEAYTQAYKSVAYLLFAHTVGFVCMLPGGAWTAKLSVRCCKRNAAIAGSLVAVLTLLSNLIPYYVPIPFWSRLLSFLLPIPAFVAGAMWQTRTA